MAHPPHPSTTHLLRRSRRFLAVTAAVTGLALTAVAGPALADPTPTPSGTTAPTLASVTEKLTELSQQNEQLTEKFNAANIDLTAKQATATTANAAAATAQADYKAALKRFGSTIVDQYQNGQLSKAGALLTSDSTQDYLDTVSDLATVSQHNSAVVDKLSAAKTQAATAQAAATKAVADATAVRDSLAAQQKTIETQTAQYKTMLASLTPAAQTAYLTKGDAPAPANIQVHAGSAAAQAAIDFALAQRGKPYVYAAAGPNAYDCSGLTMAAYAAGGVSLPHNAAAQYNYGTHVPLSAMEPGDLIFFYSPIGHVGIYLGNGLMIHAPTSGDVVKVSSIFDGAVGATRLT